MNGSCYLEGSFNLNLLLVGWMQNIGDVLGEEE